MGVGGQVGVGQGDVGGQMGVGQGDVGGQVGVGQGVVGGQVGVGQVDVAGQVGIGGQVVTVGGQSVTSIRKDMSCKIVKMYNTNSL